MVQPCFTAYGAAKAALSFMTRNMAPELAPKVRVNCVAPGWIKTSWGEQASETWQRRAVRESMLGRWGTPEDVASAVAAIALDLLPFSTGEVINVDGGFHLRRL